MAWSDKVWKDDVDDAVRRAVNSSANYTKQEVRKFDNQITSFERELKAMKQENYEMREKINNISDLAIKRIDELVEIIEKEKQEKEEMLNMMKTIIEFLQKEKMNR